MFVLHDNMSSSNDPVTVILDHAHAWKDQGAKMFHSTIDTIKDSGAYGYVEGVISGSKPVVFSAPAAAPPPSILERSTNWVKLHKWTVGVIAGVATTGTLYWMFVANKPAKRRRAKKAANGARKEVVLVAGSPSEGITRILADDLNKRGFIVYMTTSSKEEEEMVAREDCPDIRSLPIKANESSSIQETSKNLEQILNTPVKVFDDEQHKLSLAGVLVVPDLFFPAGPVESIRADVWSDVIYSKLLGPVFLLSNGLLEVVRRQNSRVVLLSPTIMSSLNPAFHAAECITSNALSSLALCLHRELKPQGIPFVHLKLGSFDIRPGRSNSTASQRRQIDSAMRADVLSWSDRLKELYAQAYRSSAHLQTSRASGSNLRVLNHAVFDALTEKKPKRVYHVGRGSYAYQWLTDRTPEFIMTWLLQPHVDVNVNHNAAHDQEWETV